VHPEPFNPNSRLRASDADREQAADVLNAALAEGRLAVAEHSDRLDAVYEAKTHAEIAPLIEDLPAGATTPSPARRTDLAPVTRRRQLIIAIFGGAMRNLRAVPRRRPGHAKASRCWPARAGPVYVNSWYCPGDTGASRCGPAPSM
jgi:hypothetical protein